MLLLTLRDLQFRVVRVTVVTVLIGLILGLLFVMNGLVHQLRTEPYRAVAAIGADYWMVSSGVSGPFTAASILPIDAAAAFGEDAQPLVVARASMGGRSESDSPEPEEIFVIGHVQGELGSPPIASGRAADGPTEVVVDSNLGLAPGDLANLSGIDVTVVGTSESTTILGGVPFVFVDLGVAQDAAFGNRETVSAILTTESPPPGLGGVEILTAEEAADDAFRPIGSAVDSINFVRILLWVVAAIVVGAVIYLSALERQRDFAVLKAMGTSGRALGAGLALQAASIALVAATLGAVLGRLIEPNFPVAIDVPGEAYWRVPLVALVMGLIASIVGVWRVNRTDPVEAFGDAR